MIQLGAPQNKKTVVTNNGLNKDIIAAIHAALPAARQEVKQFSKQFKGANNEETARNIWNYLRRLKYVKDPQGFQYIKLPKKLVSSSGDCKSFSLLTAAILQNLKMPAIFRYTSYEKNDPTPSHIYTITKDENGREIIIDGVYTKFNKEVPYKHKKDYTMQIAVINGTPAQETAANIRKINVVRKKRYSPEQLQTKFLTKALTKVRAGGFIFNLIQNELRRINRTPSNIIYSPEQLQKYLQRLKNRKGLMATNNWVSKLIQNEINAIETNRFTGLIKFAHTDKALHGFEEEIGKLSLKKLGKKLKKGLKKISLKNVMKAIKKIGLAIPRKAFLSLVFLNVRGLGKRLSKLSDNQLNSLWVDKFGGKLGTLKKAIAKGAKKRPLFGASKRVKQLKGIGYVVYGPDTTEIHGIGEFERSEYVTQLSNKEERQIKREQKQGSKLDTSTLFTGGAATAAAATAAAANPAGAASVASIIAAAAPVLIVVAKALTKAGVPEETAPASAAGESSNFTDAAGDAAQSNSSFEKYASQAVDIAEKVGIIPSRSNTPTEEAVNNALPSGDTDEEKNEEAAATGTTTGGSKLMLPLLIGGAAALYFLSNKKRSKK